MPELRGRTRRLRVVTLIDKPDITGGGERMAVSLAMRFDPTRFESILCATRPSTGPTFERELAEAGVANRQARPWVEVRPRRLAPADLAAAKRARRGAPRSQVRLQPVGLADRTPRPRAGRGRPRAELGLGALRACRRARSRDPRPGGDLAPGECLHRGLRSGSQAHDRGRGDRARANPRAAERRAEVRCRRAPTSAKSSGSAQAHPWWQPSASFAPRRRSRCWSTRQLSCAPTSRS